MKRDRAIDKCNSLAAGELLVPFIIYLLLYLLTLSNVPSIAADSIYYINQIDSGQELFHPHHLLYQPLAWMWIAFWRQIGVQTDSLILVSGLNAVFGALTLCVFYSFLRRRLGADRLVSFLGTSLPAFSFAFWYYSGNIEVYIIPLFLLWLGFYMLTADHVPAKTFLLVGFLNAIAALIAQMSILFATVVFVAAWYSHRRGDCSLFKALANYISAAVPTAGIPYLIALLSAAAASSQLSSLFWLTAYAHDSRFWNSLSASAVAKSAVGFGQAFVGSHFLFALPNVGSLIAKTFPGFYFTHEAYLVRNLNPRLAYVLGALSLCLGAVVVVAFAASLARWSRIPLRKRSFIYLLVVWLLAYGIFTFFYTAINAKLWIVQVFCIWMLFLIVLLGSRSSREATKWPKAALASLTAVLFFVNFAGSIRFTHERANDYYYSKVQPLLQISHRHDLVIIGTAWKFEAYLQRYGTASILTLTSVYRESGPSPESLLKVQSAIDGVLASGGTVIVSSEAVDFEKETTQLYPKIGIFATVWDKYRHDWCEREFPAGHVFILERSSKEVATGSARSPSGSACGSISTPDKAEASFALHPSIRQRISESRRPDQPVPR